MGNTFCCADGTTVVRVYVLKGETLEYDHPVPASRVMREHPHHLLLYRHCRGKAAVHSHLQSSIIAKWKALNHDGELRAVRWKDTLSTGKEYFLVHVPDQYIARFAQCVDYGALGGHNAGPKFATTKGEMTSRSQRQRNSSPSSRSGRLGAKGSVRFDSPRRSPAFKTVSSLKSPGARSDEFDDAKAGQYSRLCSTVSRSSRVLSMGGIPVGSARHRRRQMSGPRYRGTSRNQWMPALYSISEVTN